MYSSLNLKAVLEDHPLFQALSKQKDDKNISNDTRPFQLIHIYGGNIFVWEDQQSCLLTANFQEALGEKEETTNIQTLLCRNPPLFEVRCIVFNETNSHVALICTRGVSVLALPKRWGRHADFEGGKSRITCRTLAVAERFFTTNVSIQLIQASWYPGEESPHLCLLTSDNVLRIYNVQSDPQTPVQSHRLNPISETNLSLSGSLVSLVSMYSVATSLGETVVAFDFAPIVEYSPKQNLLQRKPKETILLQPIYLLQGNGDILLLLTSLSDNKFSKGVLHGPLIMLPPAEDNYGTDSCSIHVMKTTPSVIVIATCTGKLHHCISLWSQNTSDDVDPADSLDVQSIISRSLSLSGMSIDGELIAPTLYVYETVELELDLSSSEEEPLSHFISLHGDPLLSCRYHCCTSIGIHSVALPWLNKMNAFVHDDEEENKEMLSEFTQDDHCIVEHVLCTKPTTSSPACHIRGFTITTNPMFGPSLICLTDDNHCTALQLLNTFRPISPPLVSTMVDESTIVNSPLKKLTETSFDDHIRSLLKRDVSQPLIRSGISSSSFNEEECLQLVTKATQVLRSEYIAKQKLARDAIVKRVQLLNEQKQQQLSDFQQLQVTRERLTVTAEDIAVTYEDCLERQEHLQERLDAIIKRIKTTDPVLSKAEINMGKELRAISERLRRLDNNIKQLKVKQEYQSKKQKKEDELDRCSTEAKDLTGKSLQTDQFKQLILEQGEKISELIKKLNNLNVQVGL